jgi:hypothetical protein
MVRNRARDQLEISKEGKGGTRGSSVPGTIVVWESVSTEAAATATAAMELEAVILSLLGDARVVEGDILDLDDGLLHVGG